MRQNLVEHLESRGWTLEQLADFDVLNFLHAVADHQVSLGMPTAAKATRDYRDVLATWIEAD